jgi:hypothetical protein
MINHTKSLSIGSLSVEKPPLIRPLPAPTPTFGLSVLQKGRESKPPLVRPLPAPTPTFGLSVLQKGRESKLVP